MEKKKIISPFKTIKLKRTACYGPCPIYNVEIYSDGTVTYCGEMFVEKDGVHIWNLEPEAIKALNEAILKYDYFKIKARKPTEELTDNPSCITSVLLEDGIYKRINNYHGNDKYPLMLQRFEKLIDKIIGVKEYIGKRI